MLFEELLLITPLLGSAAAAIVANIRARRAARDSKVAAEKSEVILVRDIEDEIAKLREEDAQTDTQVILAAINEIASVPNKEAEKFEDKSARAIRLNTLSIIFSTIFGVLVFIATPVSNAIFNKEPVPCVDAIQKAIEIAKTSPEAWVPLADDDKYNQDCHINTVFLKATGRTP